MIRDLEHLKGDLRSLDGLKDQHIERSASQTQRQAHYKILTTQLSVRHISEVCRLVVAGTKPIFFLSQQADRQRLRAEEKLQEVRASHQQKQESARRKYEVLQERYRKLVVTRGERDLDDSQQKEAMELIVKEVSSSMIVARFQMLTSRPHEARDFYRRAAS